MARKTTQRRPAGRKAPARVSPKAPVVIDVHTHVIVPDVFKVTAKRGLNARIGQSPSSFSGANANDAGIEEAMTSLKRRLKDMDKMGIDIQILSPSIVHQCAYWAKPEQALKLERKSNDFMAEVVAESPDRLVGIGSVPLQDPALAVRELDRCVNKLGLRGVTISSHVNDWELGDKPLWPFWRKVEQLGVPVFIHPAGNSDKRLWRYGFAFTIGQPWEETIAMSSLAFDGVMDAFPKVKILVAHGGGYLPYYAGRLDGGYRRARKAGARSRLKREFSGYVKKFYYDTVIFNTDMLEFLATKAPMNHIVMGTDYPFAEDRPVQFVRKAKISKADQDAILGANAARLFGIRI